MTPDDVEVLEYGVPFQGYYRIETYQLRHRLFAGGWSDPIDREMLERGHAVGVVLYDPDLDTLVLIEQFRIGAFAACRTPWMPEGSSPWLLEIVAGIIDDGETPENVARREAIEEAGCEVAELEFVCRVLATPGVSSEVILLYVGRVDASNVGGVHGLDHEHEDIRVLTASSSEVFGMLDAGKIINSTALVALQWFRAKHLDLRARWRKTSTP